MWSSLLVWTLLVVTRCSASESSFSVNDDVFAFPQYDVVFSESYIHHDEALRRMSKDSTQAKDVKDGDLAQHVVASSSSSDFNSSREEYQWMNLRDQPYLCTIPVVRPTENTTVDHKPSETEQKMELERAVQRGRELLSGMEGKQCLFYSTGWWTYSFCYNSQVRQFHALSPGAGGTRVWPPQEDPHTTSFILGKFNQPKDANSGQPETGLAELSNKAETSYLVQKLEGGTACDLTGINRKVEVQYHCNPQLTDRIGWIKETSTCSYMMIVYTPRLCNDLAFLPPKESRAHAITCQEILTDIDIPAWEERKRNEALRKMIDQGNNQRPVVGNIEIGAMKHVGKEGAKLERGKIVLTSEEKAEIIVMQKAGQISSISKADLKKLDLDPKDVESFRKELQKLAGDKDWKIERLDDINGQVQLRGVVSNDDEDEVHDNKQENPIDEEQVGSEEEYKDEV